MEHWQVVIVVVGTMVSIWGLFLRASWRMDQKIVRIYERLDEYKKLSDKIFVRRDMCDQTVRFNADLYERLETRIAAFSLEFKQEMAEMKKLFIDFLKHASKK
jgi:hypothetical protein